MMGKCKRGRDLKGIIIMMLAFTKLNKSLGDNKKLCKFAVVRTIFVNEGWEVNHNAFCY